MSPRSLVLMGVAISFVAVTLVTVVTAGSDRAGAAPSAEAGPATLRLGFFPNITHGPALVGVEEGIFAKDLLPDHLDASQTFSAGSTEASALLAGSIDVAFIGPSPAINAFVKSHGAIRIIAGAASGGAALVVKSSITNVRQLGGTTLATPQLSNTQDVALRYFLRTHGYKTTGSGPRAVTVSPNTTGSNATIVQEFRQGLIAGAWVPEPYVAEMVAYGGHVLVNESSLWTGGRFVTTNVIVRTAFVEAHPLTVRRFLKGLVASVNTMTKSPDGSKSAANVELAKLSGKKLRTKVLNSAWSELNFTVDPLASTLATELAHAEAVGAVPSSSIKGIYDLAPLDSVLTASHLPVPSMAGIG